VPQHVTRLVVPLIVDYSASHRLVVDYSGSHRLVVDYLDSRGLVVDYFAYAARPGASARRAARHTARRRLLRLRRASGCLRTSHGSSCSSSSTTSTTPRVRLLRHVARLIVSLAVEYFASRKLVVDYFAYAARPGASARRTARHAARR
jgi:hypothetical protein